MNPQKNQSVFNFEVFEVPNYDKPKHFPTTYTPRFHFQQSHYSATEQQDVAGWRQEVWQHFRAGQPDAPINKT